MSGQSLQVVHLGRDRALTKLLSALQVWVDQRTDGSGAVGKVDVWCCDPLSIQILCQTCHLQEHARSATCIQDSTSRRMIAQYGLRMTNRGWVREWRRWMETAARRQPGLSLTCVDFPDLSRPSSTMNAPLRAIWDGPVWRQESLLGGKTRTQPKKNHVSKARLWALLHDSNHETSSEQDTCLPHQDHVYITTDKLFCFHNLEFDEMPCKLDSTENPRSFKKYQIPP